MRPYEGYASLDLSPEGQPLSAVRLSGREYHVPHWPHASVFSKFVPCRHMSALYATASHFAFTFQQNRTSWSGRPASGRLVLSASGNDTGTVTSR